jgi:hypothetical protein
MDLIAPAQEPIHIVQTPATGIDAHQGTRSFALIQRQGPLSRLHQRLQRGGQLRRAAKEPIHDDLLIARRQDAPQLAPTPIALLGKIPLAGKSGFLPTGQATHIDIEQLPGCGVVVLIALTVLTIDSIERVFHLADIRARAGIQRFLHYRLLSTAHAPECRLQGAVATQAGVDFDQPMRASQQTDEGVIQLVDGCVHDGLLSNPHPFSDRAKQIQLTHLDANGGQTSTGRKMPRWVHARLVHGGGPPISGLRLLDRYGPSSFVWQILCCRQQTAATLEQI